MRLLLPLLLLICLTSVLLPAVSPTPSEASASSAADWSTAGSRLFDPDKPPATRLVGLEPVDPQPFHTASISTARPYPDTLLLFSDGWYGARLAEAARALGLALTPEQLLALETAAALHGVNTRVLLVAAAIGGLDGRALDDAAWESWLAEQIARVRAALEPHPASLMRVTGSSGETVVPAEDTADLGLALLLSPAAGAEDFETLLGRFDELYAQAFGDPTVDAAIEQAPQPFLAHPFQGTPLSHGYYDHTYPSIDNGSTPNVAGMLDYLGRHDTSYDTHDGDDFGLPYGTPIVAPAAGLLYNRLPSAASDGGVLIVSGSYEILIWHLSAVLIGESGTQTGTPVAKGQQIGRSGSAGGLAHIHFEVRWNGRQIDTMGWYGGGPDPCPLGPAGWSAYKGCAASVWLWSDQAPPARTSTPTPTITPTGTPTPTPTATPSLALSATLAAPGSVLLLTGSGFSRLVSLRVSVNGTALGSAQTDGDGGFQLALITMPGAREGYYRVLVQAERGAEQAWALYRLRPDGSLRTIDGGSTTQLAVPGTISPYTYWSRTFLPAVRR